MKPIDVVSTSPLFAVGTTNGEYNHVGGAAPRAVLVCVFGYTANVTAVTAVTYGGTALTECAGAGAIGPNPFPYTTFFFKDNIGAGEKVVKVTKNTNDKVYVVTITINATGAVEFIKGNGGGGENEQASVPSLTTSGNEQMGFGIQLAKTGAGAPLSAERLAGIMKAFTEGEMRFEVVGQEFPKGGASTFEWRYTAKKINARSGVILKIPGLTIPANREFVADGSVPYMTQWGFIPALTEKARLVQEHLPPGAENAFLFERNVGEEKVANGFRCECNSGLNYAVNNERWFEFYRYQITRYKGGYNLFWQLHDQSGGSPPVCLLEQEETLFFGPGSGSGWWLESAAQPFETLWHYKVMVKVGEAGIAKLWINGSLVKTQNPANTLGVGPTIYDKMGIYTTEALAEPSKSIHGLYYVSNEETPAVGNINPVAMIA